jgi:hypothetical protein
MRQEPFPRRGAKVEPASHASPWWIGLAIVLALLFYFRSMYYLAGRWMDRHGCIFGMRR